MREASPESQLLTLVRQLRVLEHRLLILRSRGSVNSRALQAEVAARIDDLEQRRTAVELLMQADRGEPR
jgi:hypothetical protein